jgi:hypothetical protein
MTDDRTQQLWVAATARDEAVDRVLDVIPEGWTARLLDERFESEADIASDMAPGKVRAKRNAGLKRIKVGLAWHRTRDSYVSFV